jgi:hypothetical protein
MKIRNEAINICLQNIGEPLLGVDEVHTGIFEAEQAYFIINQTTTEILSEGWIINTDEEWPLSKNEDDYIAVPPNVLTLKTSDRTLNIVVKDYKLYNKDTHTYKFEDVENIKCDIAWDLDFDDLPYSFQQYITLRAARILAERLDSNTNLLQVMLRDEDNARRKLERFENEQNDYSIFDNDNVSRIIDRTTNPTRR